MKIKYILIFCIFLFSFFPTTFYVEAKTVYYPGDYTSIQEAVDSLNPFDTIEGTGSDLIKGNVIISTNNARADDFNQDLISQKNEDDV